MSVFDPMRSFSVESGRCTTLDAIREAGSPRALTAAADQPDSPLLARRLSPVL